MGVSGEEVRETSEPSCPGRSGQHTRVQDQKIEAGQENELQELVAIKGKAFCRSLVLELEF